MQTVIYFTNDTLKIVKGSYSHKKNKVIIDTCDTILLDEGVLINGVITDSEELEKVLNRLATQEKYLKKLV